MAEYLKKNRQWLATSLLLLVSVFWLSTAQASDYSNYQAAPEKKVVLITGTASGIGRATAKNLLTQGHIVYGADIQYEKNQYLKELGGHPLDMDVRIDDQVTAGVQRVLDEQGRIDVLVNNAGYAVFGHLESVPMDEVFNQFNVNVFGYARLAKAVLPHMRKQGYGRIMFVSSILGKVSSPMIGYYAASKHAVEAIADALRAEVRDLGLDVIKIQPGGINTGLDEVSMKALAELETAADYQLLKEGFQAYMTEVYASVEGPEGTAKVIAELVDKIKVKTSYRTTFDAKAAVFMEDVVSERRMDNLFLNNYHSGAE